ncbi:hypothetical protein [Burkholderia ubonensis]|uniref:hypothetical protein n=1 Tax=Burkholderia ubonensis TaxID=101571 RepID=UPI000756F0E0|nr:hypothetical protein [Burkholderia ubonensis]KVG24300.1 hypothetical protein WJ29_07085 [Burkholderia ubonensis]OJA67961.1 hypothetical protein BGV70_10175 [Burkholderia ubonensis]
MNRSRVLRRRAALYAVAACLAAAAAAEPAAAAKAAPAAGARHSPYRPDLTRRARTYYMMTRGIDNLKVHRIASDNLIRFSYRVTDPVAAKRLADRSATPYLYGQTSHALLEVPVMDKVGQLRQSGSIEAGREYWMVFSNKGNVVKSGERVNVIIGSLHIDGLVVE